MGTGLSENYNQSSRVLKYTILIVFCTLLAASSVCIIPLESLAGDIVIGKSSLKVSNGSSIVFPGGLKVAEGASVVNNGKVFFSNKNNSEFNLGSLLDGVGLYSIMGNADITVSGVGFSSLNVNSGKSVFVDSDLSIVEKLTLTTGIVDVATGKKLKILSQDKDAIVFNNSYGNQSFIQGTLSRNASAGVSYTFPIGTTFSGFHPFSVDGLVSPDYISVSYLPDFDDKWNSLHEISKGVSLVDVGGWQVATGISGTTFRPYLSLFNTSGIIDGNYMLFYTADLDASPVKFTLDNNSRLAGNNMVTSKMGAYSAGIFALNALKTEVNPDGVKIPRLINFIVADGSGRTTFEVPDIENYKQVVLSVYNRFGSKVYESNSYANDFDTRRFPQGTYFYELTLITKEEKRVLVRNIIEVARRD